MERFKFLFNILIYISLIFLAYYLYRFDYFDFQGITFNYYYLGLSISFLWAGFLLSPFAWKDLLKKNDINASYSSSLASEGIAIFTKYIPGKVMIILGRAGYISLQGHSIKRTSMVSLKAQFVAFWVGLALGSIPLFFIPDSTQLILLSFTASALIILFLHNKYIHQFLSRVLSRILNRKLQLPLLTFRNSLWAIFFYSCMWASWGMGFYLLTKATGTSIDFQLFMLFPLAATTGMLAIIIPGGLGVREGIITFVLHKAGIPLEIAATISILSRLWYLTGELFVFLTAFAIKLSMKK
ncbi:MAG: flippase-like domain-containing protein [Bacteroidetes bacterium]|nr:flippase-like domain-containing protein [Bacteroidota bacterium]MBL6964298.1 flippase-like domain-containing protein [Bacteroidota bacterium]